MSVRKVLRHGTLYLLEHAECFDSGGVHSVGVEEQEVAVGEGRDVAMRPEVMHDEV